MTITCVVGILGAHRNLLGIFYLLILKLLGNSKEIIWKIFCIYISCKFVYRDLDFNVNRQYFLSTCGDDGYMKFWDIREPTEPILSRMEHSHWVWNIRINKFHDQLVLTSSSDSRVILCSIASISSEPFGPLVSPEDDSLQHDETNKKEKYVVPIR